MPMVHLPLWACVGVGPEPRLLKRLLATFDPSVGSCSDDDDDDDSWYIYAVYPNFAKAGWLPAAWLLYIQILTIMSVSVSVAIYQQRLIVIPGRYIYDKPSSPHSSDPDNYLHGGFELYRIKFPLGIM